VNLNSTDKLADPLNHTLELNVTYLSYMQLQLQLLKELKKFFVGTIGIFSNFVQKISEILNLCCQAECQLVLIVIVIVVGGVA